MIREIKFRVFDKRIKKWKGEECPNGKMIYKSINSLIAELNPHCDEQAVMQYTGLKDKNEKEIYEGDIIKSESARNIACVEWGLKILDLGRRGRIIDRYEFNGWLVNNHKLNIKDLLDSSFCNGEVIGNIYEHPELLNY